VIDLHMHTDASDGRLSPPDLVAAAAAAGLRVISITDHDTVAGLGAAAAACETRGLELVPGIEITAVRDGADVHVLGYFFDPASAVLLDFLAAQRLRRADRVREIVRRLASLGIALDADAILAPGLSDRGKAPGRPWIARALVAAGHAATTNEAFDRWLATGRPAFVPREAASPAEVFAEIHRAGGIASLAHPGLVGHDEWIPGFVSEGLDAVEAYHSDHDEADTARYLAFAAGLGVPVSGGSDYHADPAHGAGGPGSVTLPPAAFERLKQCAATRG
jgi:predicted metal-dependent phosphoesterase TrpH